MVKIVEWGQEQSRPECNPVLRRCQGQWDQEQEAGLSEPRPAQGKGNQAEPSSLHGEGSESMLKMSLNPERLLCEHTNAHRLV